MKSIFLILLKKEFIEFMQNKKFWSFVVFVIAATVAIFFYKKKLTRSSLFNINCYARKPICF